MEPTWFYYFNHKDKNSLIKNFKDKISHENLLICQELSTRRYTIFKDYGSFGRFFQKINFEESCFYEMMRQEDMRKPYFDIDLEDGFDFDIKNLVEVIKTLLGEKLKILVFTSHWENKKSFHVVVDDVCFSELSELQCFYEEVIEKLDEKSRKFVDSSVYKSVQQFRILGSHKWGKKNVKILDENLSFNYSLPERFKKNEKSKFMYDLSISLVTNTHYCEVITKFKSKKTEEKSFGVGTSCEGDLEDVMRIFHSEYSPDDFRLSECKENNGNLLIVLRRLNPTYCKQCERVHEHENPFIVTSGEFRNIYFYCRRVEKEKLPGKFLGSLGLPNLEDISLSDVPNIQEMDIYSDEKIKVKNEDLEKKLEMISEENMESKRKVPKNRMKILNDIPMGKLLF